MREIRLHLGNNKQVLPTLSTNSVDSIVCDPPYEIGFMGNSWDKSGIAYDIEMWAECLRVLKPGGYLLAFGGSRTYHRLACAVEDAGFDIRDQIMWLYASGFPKSMDVSKAIDKASGAERSEGVREWSGEKRTGGIIKDDDSEKTTTRLIYDTPATDAAKQWEGWGTALKPAHEPIVVARKPFPGTVVNNVQQWGTGGLNIDGCRIEFASESDIKAATWGRGTDIMGGQFVGGFAPSGKTNIEANPQGRWPANLIHDGSEVVLQSFESFGEKTSGKPMGTRKAENNIYGPLGTGTEITGYGDTGSIARFFYCAKASKEDREEGLRKFEKATTSDGRTVASDNAYQRGKTVRSNTHPTVKPTALMQYLCRLVTPIGGTVLDPFMGSGSTGKGAVKEGYSFEGIELESEHFAIAEARIKHAASKYKRQTSLFQ